MRIYRNFILILFVSNLITVKAQLSTPVQDSLQSILDQFLIEDTIPGGIIAVHNRNEGWTWKGQSGIANVSTLQLADTSFDYRIGSVSKNIMATTILHLVDRNILSLNDPIDLWLPLSLTNQIPQSQNITIKQLLNHTSGVYSYTDDASFLTTLLTDPTANFTPDSLINIGLSHPPDFLSGTNWKYNNTGYVLLTKIIENSTGINYHQYATDSIISPTGLSNTYFPNTNLIFGNHMRCYANYDNDSILEDYTDITTTWAIGSGEIVSNLDDQITYFNALLDGNILSANSYNEMITPFFSGPYTYGLGSYIIDNNLIGHSGLYFSTTGLWHFQDLDIVVAYQFNLFDVDVYNKVLEKIHDLLATTNSIPEVHSSSSVFVYPTPTNNFITIDQQGFDANSLKVSIYNGLGQLVLLDQNFSGKTVDISQFQAGIYYLLLEDSTQSITKKIIKTTSD